MDKEYVRVSEVSRPGKMIREAGPFQVATASIDLTGSQPEQLDSRRSSESQNKRLRDSWTPQEKAKQKQNRYTTRPPCEIEKSLKLRLKETKSVLGTVSHR